MIANLDSFPIIWASSSVWSGFRSRTHLVCLVLLLIPCVISSSLAVGLVMLSSRLSHVYRDDTYCWRGPGEAPSLWDSGFGEYQDAPGGIVVGSALIVPVVCRCLATMFWSAGLCHGCSCFSAERVFRITFSTSLRSVLGLGVVWCIVYCLVFVGVGIALCCLFLVCSLWDGLMGLLVFELVVNVGPGALVGVEIGGEGCSCGL